MTEGDETLKTPARRPLRDTIRRVLVQAPWVLPTAVMRILYRFRVEGLDRIPHRAPFILVVNELSPIAMLVSGWLSIAQIFKALDKKTGSTFTYMQEDLWSVSYFKKVTGRSARGHYAPLIPFSAGRLALSLLDGLRMLRQEGIVVLNAEGDMPWDGRPLPLGRALAWLALHSGAPIVPALCSVSTYDIWPRWQTRPNLRGRIRLSVGEPFRLSEVPLDSVTDAELDEATARTRERFDAIRFPPGGPAEWSGPALRDGKLLVAPVDLSAAGQVAVQPERTNVYIPARKRGMALLLWQCPICHTNDALLHSRPRFRRERLSCLSCGTGWEVRRVVGGDFRLEVVEGPASVLGLEMALSSWYDEMKKGFRPAVARLVQGAELRPGEEVYLQAPGVSLLPYRPNPLFDGLTGREPPRAQAAGRPEYADWAPIGQGRLLLTNQRLLWQGPQGELDFEWSQVSSLYLWIFNTLGTRYGTAQYRFGLGQETGLKWLYHAGLQASRAAELAGRRVVVAPF